MSRSKAPRAAIYARVSKPDKRGERVQYPENQLPSLRELCAREGFQIIGEYVDRKTGGTAEREQFDRLFKDAARRKFDVLVFWALDRFSREGVLPTLQRLELLRKLGVRFVSYSEPFITSMGPFGDAILAIIATLAKMERDRISARTLEGLKRARAAGRIGGRPRARLDIERARTLADSGVNLTDIGEALGVSRATVRRALGRGTA